MFYMRVETFHMHALMNCLHSPSPLSLPAGLRAPLLLPIRECRPASAQSGDRLENGRPPLRKGEGIQPTMTGKESEGEREI